MTCTCSNPKCPNARQFNACQHCMCLQHPGPGANLYAGPRGVKCCKCGYFAELGAGIR